MKHLGDITKINGAEIPVVDIVTGGSPCQDLSVAGKRAGLHHSDLGDEETTRSGLFMDQLRIVKEMRERERATGRAGWMVRPRYMVWENVPGAFSSGNPKGADFAAVIEEIIKVAEPGAAVSVCIPNGGWTKSGCYYAEDGSWSLAWRVHDAQFWGVPQRRKRIALVADFGGLSAPEVLFERKGLSRDIEPCGETGQETPRAVGGSVEGAGGEVAATITATYGTKWNGNALQTSGVVGKGNGEAFLMPEKTSSLTVGGGMPGQGYPCVLQNAVYDARGNGANIVAVHQNASGEVRENDVAYTIGTNANASGRNTPLVYDARGNGDGKTVCTITGDHESCVTDYTALCVGNGQANQSVSEDVSGALRAEEHGHQPILFEPRSQDGVPRIHGDVSPTLNTAQGGQRQPCVVDTYQETDGALCAGISKQVGNQIVSQDQLITKNAIVRRLTPLECERLQGYPDGWTDIGDYTDESGRLRKEADTAKYKATGNSIALPFWAWLFRRINAYYERPATMGSLFDGIGGFPLTALRSGIKPLWASEIEAFPIAVCKKHFGDEGAGIEGDVWKFL